MHILQTVDLAMWLETSKMRPNLTGNLLGGGLLADMLTRMSAAQQAVSRGSQVCHCVKLEEGVPPA